MGSTDGEERFEAHAQAMHSFHTLEVLVADRRDALATDAARRRLVRLSRQVRRLPPQPPRDRR